MNVGRYLRGEDRHVGSARITHPRKEVTMPVSSKRTSTDCEPAIGAVSFAPHNPPAQKGATSMEIKIPEARLSFDVLGEPKGYDDKPPRRWGAVFLIPKGSPTDKAIRDALKAVAAEKWPKKTDVILADILADKKGCCYQDGDKKDYDGYEGMMALSAYRYEDKGPPKILDNDTSPIYREDRTFYEGKAGRIFAGCFVRGLVEIWAQDNTKGGKGLRATLQVVQRLRKGDSFGGGKPPDASGFEAVEEGADADDDMS